QTIAGCRKLHGGHGIEEARSEPAQASISQTGIWLLLQQFKPVDSFLFDHTLDHRIKQEIRHIVGKRTSKKKFHGQVVDPFRILLLIRGLSLNPALCQDVTYRVREGFEAFPRAGYFWVDRAIKNEVTIVERVCSSGKLN